MCRYLGVILVAKKLMSFIMILAFFLFAGCSKEEEVPISEIDAEKLYQQKCSVCHGADLKGDTAADLSKIGNKYSKEEIEEIILKGISNMPKKLYKGAEAEAIAEWLSSMK